MLGAIIGVTKFPLNAHRACLLALTFKQLLDKHILDLPTLPFFILLAHLQTARSTTPNLVTNVNN
jgi:hypothetical protein